MFSVINFQFSTISGIQRPLVYVMIFWIEIIDMTNRQNKKLASIDVVINYFFILANSYANNFNPKKLQQGLN